MFIRNFGRNFLRMADGDGASGGAGGQTGGTSGGAQGGQQGGATPPWYDGYDAETKGYIQNKGLDKKTATEAFLEVSKFHREAEKFVGAPANEILRLPKDANAPEWKNVWERLGKPKEAKEYDFSAVKHSDGKAIDQELADHIREAAFNANLDKTRAEQLAASIVKRLDGKAASDAALRADKLAQEKADLKKNWGNNEAANMVVARAAAEKLGIAPEAVAALEGQIGYAKVMEMFRTIGSKIGEDRFVTSGGQGGGQVMTRDQAVAEKADLQRDEAWVKRYLAGGVEEGRKMTAINRIISGVACLLLAFLLVMPVYAEDNDDYSAQDDNTGDEIIAVPIVVAVVAASVMAENR